ncbi:MAG TPA: HepT-like ribonuclease domain-containing protein [Polyangia bacterium]|jgi:uncharacterized protein YutE (UPF0331/DUF86 family)
MTRAELVLSKAARVRRRLTRLRTALAPGRPAFVADEALVEQAAFNLYLAMQESVDLGSHIVADEGYGTPETLGEVFDLLGARAVITATTAQAMRRGTKLRNLIAHAYGDVDPGLLFQAASAGIAEIEQFLIEVADWMASRSGG